MRPRNASLLTAALTLSVACGDDSRETGGSASASGATIGTITVSGSASASASASASGTDGGTDSDGTSAGTEGSASSASGASDTIPGPKFDLGEVPDGGIFPEDEGCKNVDLLFVIDNSGSMEDEQVNLINSFPGFVNAMQMQLDSAESYHVGVTTSDVNAYNACSGFGSLVTRTGGANSSNATCTPYASGKAFMNEADDLGQKFQCAAKVGTGGDGNEQPMYTMGLALSQGLNGPGACNDGFIREDALLVVVVITDEEDDHEVNACNQLPQSGSPGEPGDWYNQLVAVKSGVESNIVVLSLIGPPAPNSCPALDKCNGGIQGAEVASRIAQFTGMFTYGTVGQVCAPSYDTFFSQAIGVIDSACKNFKPPG
ncbi:MAG: hypothetical protein KC420_10360 [Myxococcales bacterium]|nr:hypothetical protein [Myxococcales bacterium]MCB9570255.1 hypothetical protein [Myxococcales bacterium]MCB9705257.1 hypothetical protein [Myxococcales bacterium]